MTENRIAVFLDFENVKRAVDDYFVNERVELKRIFDEVARVGEGRIVIKRAYADWGVFRDYRSDLLDTATEPIQTFALNYKGKNGADIRLAIDVMDIVLRQADITHVALVSGDSDFTPLVMKLREFGRFVIGVGVRSNTSNYLARACDDFSYYDDLRGVDGGAAPERAFPSAPMDPAALLARALADLGNRPVSGSALKTQMRRVDPMFDESRHGHGSFLDFLRAHRGTLIDLHKPAIGDVTVAPKGGLLAPAETAPEDAAANGNGHYTAAAAPAYAIASEEGPRPGVSFTPAAPLTPGERYRLWLRDNNFRYVPSGERREIMRVVYDMFRPHHDDGVPISLTEAKDRLHGWFEENRPAVSWESINSTVYHLFYTWCFVFDRSGSGEGSRPLWDRPTRLQADIHSADDLIDRCDRAIARKLWERDRGDVDAVALNEWLHDGDPDRLPHVKELLRSCFPVPVAAAGLIDEPRPPDNLPATENETADGILHENGSDADREAAERE